MTGLLGNVAPVPIHLADGWGIVRCVRSASGARVRVLQTGGVYQSATYVGAHRMEPVFSYYRAFDQAFSVRPGTRRALMVGGGGYAWPKHVLACRGGSVTVDVVEIDPAVTRAAQKWFFLNEAMAQHPERLRLITDDGRAYLERYGAELQLAGDGEWPVHADAVGEQVACADASGEQAARDAGGGRRLARAAAKDAGDSIASDGSPVTVPYDAIVLDAFSGAEPVRSLATVEAARAARACLVGDGLVLANVVSADGGADISFLRDVVATLGDVFAHVHVVLCDEDEFAAEDNYLVVASDVAWPVSDEIPYERDFPGTPLWD